MVINNNENIENIKEIEVVQNIKYLVVIIDNKNNCFNLQKDEKIR